MSQRWQILALEAFLRSAQAHCDATSTATDSFFRANPCVVDELLIERIASDGAKDETAAVDSFGASVRERFIRILGALTEIALQSSLCDDGENLSGIRRFYLEPQASYSLAELAALWNVTLDDVCVIFHDELNDWLEAHPEAADALRLAWADAHRAADRFGVIRPFSLECALGPDFVRARPESSRTVPILLHLPQVAIDSIAAQALKIGSKSLAALVERFIFDCLDEGVRDRRSVSRVSHRPNDGNGHHHCVTS